MCTGIGALHYPGAKWTRPSTAAEIAGNIFIYRPSTDTSAAGQGGV